MSADSGDNVPTGKSSPRHDIFAAKSSQTKTREVKFTHKWIIDNFAYYCYDTVKDDETGTLRPGNRANVQPQVNANAGHGHEGPGPQQEQQQVNNDEAPPRIHAIDTRYIRSNTFCSPAHSYHRFHLDLWPNGNDVADSEFVSVFLNYEHPALPLMTIRYKIAILNENNEAIYHSGCK